MKSVINPYSPTSPSIAAIVVGLIIFLMPRAVFADNVAATTPAPTSAPAAAADGTAPADAAAAAAAKLQAIKESQNPVGNLAILPFQFNWNYASGPFQRTLFNMNFQPVFPVMLSPRANLIERAVIPVINAPSNLAPALCPPQFGSAFGCGSTLGIGNVQLQSYYAPKVNPNGFIWGAGPILQFPTITPTLGSQKLNAGINAVGLVMPGRWVVGMLVTQAWTVAGPKSAPANDNFLAQPFINYNFGKGFALSEAPVITANWSAPGNQKWTVPIGLVISQTVVVQRQPMSFGFGYYGNVVRPTFAPYGQLRFQWALLFPVKR